MQHARTTCNHFVHGAATTVYYDAMKLFFLCRWIDDKERLLAVCTDYLSDFNATSKKPMPLVLFSFALEHIARICRVLSLPGGHALLVGLGGSGRQSLTRLAAYMEEFEVFQIEVTKAYSRADWHEDLRKARYCWMRVCLP